MRAFRWLERLRKSEGGNVLVVGAASMPLLIGSAALAIDTIQLSLWKRQLQRAADSGAIAGAYALGQGVAGDALDGEVDRDLAANEHPSLTGVVVSTGSYGEGQIDSDTCADRGLDPCFDRAVEVALTTQRTLPFMSIFTDSATVIRAEAAAALVPEGEYCMISLYNGTQAGISANGNADVTLGCGMGTNSRSDDAVTAGGSSSITATPIGAVGGLDGEGNNFVGETQLQPHSAPIRDPLSHIPDPVVPSDCDDALSVGNHVETTLDPGSDGVFCSTSWDIKGTLKLQPGVYIVDGGDIDIKGMVQSIADSSGSNGGVTIIMTGPGGDAGDLKINAQAVLNLKGSTSGDYKGVVFYRDRRASNIEIKINGGASSVLEGAFYMPSSDITMTGNAGMDVTCLQMIGQKLKFHGTASITNECPADSGASAFKINVVRLVG